jgi:hypothetical protein
MKKGKEKKKLKTVVFHLKGDIKNFKKESKEDQELLKKLRKK